MADNPFDQFDAQTAAGATGNPFDQFEPAPPAGLPAFRKTAQSLPYIGPALAALDAATAKSQDWFAPTKFLNSINSPLLDWSGTPNKDIHAAESADAETNHPVASAIGAAGGAFMNMPGTAWGAVPISGAVLPAARVAASTVGGALGGASQGDSAADRAENALYGGGAGLGLGAVGEAARAAIPAIRPALHAVQGVSLPAYLALEHYADWFKENVGRHLPIATTALAGLLGAPYFSPKAGELVAPNPSGGTARQ